MISISMIDPAVRGSTGDGPSPVPLSDRFNQALAERYLWAGTERDAILASANDPATAADPQALYALQLRQEAYTKQIALASALVSHATKGIETLVKS